MKFNFVLLLIQLFFAPGLVQAAHVTDRKLQATDIVNAAGVSVFKFPTTAPTASRACHINGDGEVTSSSVTSTELGLLSGKTTLADLDSNAFTDTQTITKDGLVTTTANALLQRNSTAATNAVRVQVSPATEWEGQGYKTFGPAASQSVKFRLYNLPESSTSLAFGHFRLDSSSNGGAYSNIFDITTGNASLTATPITSWTGPYTHSYTNNTVAVGLQDHLTLSNPSGNQTHMKWLFGSTPKAALSITSAGEWGQQTIGSYTFQSGGTIGSSFPALSFNNSSLIYYGGRAGFSGSVTVASTDTSPPARLSVYGGVAVKGTNVTTASATVDGQSAVYWCDTSAAAFCSGTVDVACSTYMTEGACSPHEPAGCSWAGGACSAFTGQGDGVCTTGHPGCTAGTSPCGDYNEDLATCALVDGCSVSNTGDCGDYSNTDEATCTAVAGCGWSDPDCSGNYSICAGNYSNNTCLGTWGICNGTATCAQATNDGEAPCNAEASCAWTQGIVLNLPAVSSASAQRTNTGLLTRIVKVNAGFGTVVVTPNGSDTIEDAASLTLTNKWDDVTLHPRRITASCSGFLSEGACSPSGCAWSNGCTASTEEACTDPGCSWAEETGCTGNYACTGEYDGVSTWIKW